jgi:hypothetical protein
MQILRPLATSFVKEELPQVVFWVEGWVFAVMGVVYKIPLASWARRRNDKMQVFQQKST